MRKTPVTRKSISPAQFRNFIFAGRSVFTLENGSTGNYLTFRIKAIKKKGQILPGQFSVECKVLGDASSGYNFLGFLNLNIKYFKEWGGTSKESIAYKTFYWMMRNMHRLESFSDLSIYHEGSCCKCGMPLTVPESIDSGIGPECRKKMLEASIKILKDLNLWNSKISYEENARLALHENPHLWNKIHVPESISLLKEFTAHQVLDRFSLLG